MTQTLKPGDKVLCDLHPERGVGTATYVGYTDGKCFIVWGKFGVMQDRKYASCDLIHVRPAGATQERRRRFTVQKATR